MDNLKALENSINEIKTLVFKAEILDSMGYEFIGHMNFDIDEFEVLNYIEKEIRDLDNDQNKAINKILIDLFDRDDQRETLIMKLEDIASEISTICSVIEEGYSQIGYNYERGFDIQQMEISCQGLDRLKVAEVFEEVKNSINLYIESNLDCLKEMITNRGRLSEKFDNLISPILHLVNALEDIESVNNNWHGSFYAIQNMGYEDFGSQLYREESRLAFIQKRSEGLNEELQIILRDFVLEATRKIYA